MPALDPRYWQELIQEWENQVDAALDADSRQVLSEEICSDFGISLREALKHDAKVRGKGAEALTLDIYGSLLRQTIKEADRNDNESRVALEDLSAAVLLVQDEVTALKSRIIEDAEMVIENIRIAEDQLRQQLQFVVAEARNLGSLAVAIKEDSADIITAMNDLGYKVDEFRRSRIVQDIAIPPVSEPAARIDNWLREEQRRRPPTRLRSNVEARTQESEAWLNVALRLLSAFLAENAWAESIPIARRVADLAPSQGFLAQGNDDSWARAWPLDMLSTQKQLELCLILRAARDGRRASALARGVMNLCREAAVLRPTDAATIRSLVTALGELGAIAQMEGDEEEEAMRHLGEALLHTNEAYARTRTFRNEP